MTASRPTVWRLASGAAVRTGGRVQGPGCGAQKREPELASRVPVKPDTVQSKAAQTAARRLRPAIMGSFFGSSCQFVQTATSFFPSFICVIQ
jgi:hypothetical protein